MLCVLYVCDRKRVYCFCVDSSYLEQEFDKPLIHGLLVQSVIITFSDLH